MLKRLIIVFLLLIPISQHIALSQCNCSAAGALGGAVPISSAANVGTMDKNTLRLTAFYRYTYGDQFYYGTDPVGFGYEEKIYFNYFALNTIYGITQRLSVEADFGFFHYLSENLCNPNERGTDLSNMAISAKYNLINSKKHKFELTLGAGGKIPLARREVEFEGFAMPVSSAYGAIFQSVIRKDFFAGKLRTMLYNRYELNSINPDDYVYGNSIISSLIFAAPIYNKFSSAIEFTNDVRNQDRFIDEKVRNTGMTYYNAVPHISYSNQDWAFDFSVSVPIYRDFTGTQLSNKFITSLSASKTFDFNKKHEFYDEYLEHQDEFDSFEDFKEYFKLD